MQYIISLIVFVVIFFLSIQLFPKKEDRAIRQRLASERNREGEKKSPFVHFLETIAPVNRFLILTPVREKVKTSLTSAGLSLTVNEYFAFKELCAIFLPLLYVIIVGLPNAEPTWLFAAAISGLILPLLWVKQKMGTRQRAIIKALPNVIDLLNLAVGAGLDFMLAVKKMVERTRPNPLIEELNQAWRETKMGKTRREALRNMARRINLPEVSSFVRTLVQADKMGTGIEEALRTQSEEVLTWCFQKGERQALKAPIKMLFPLLVFILPVVLIIVAGPILLQFIQGGFGLGTIR